MKELYIDAHEELMDESMADWEAANPNATPEEYAKAESRIYDETADAAYGRMTDKYAAMVDWARDLAKEGKL